MKHTEAALELEDLNVEKDVLRSDLVDELYRQLDQIDRKEFGNYPNQDPSNDQPIPHEIAKYGQTNVTNISHMDRESILSILS